MVDLGMHVTAETLKFYSDASANHKLGYGAVFDKKCLYNQWEHNYIKTYESSIEYLELYALMAAVLTWGHLIQNKRVIIFYDNSAVVQMINLSTSSCKNCMYLIRLLVLNGLVNNWRIFARHVTSKHNGPSDALSRLQLNWFHHLCPDMEPQPCKVSHLVWPASNIWQNFNLLQAQELKPRVHHHHQRDL